MYLATLSARLENGLLDQRVDGVAHHRPDAGC